MTRNVGLAAIALSLMVPGVAWAQPVKGPVALTGATPRASGWRAVPVVEGLERPWGMAWLPDGSMLITERAGRLRLVRDGALVPEPIAGLPEVRQIGQGGLMDVSLHPRFAENGLVYLTYTSGERTANRTNVARGRLDGAALRDVEILFKVGDEKPGGQHFGSRILWLPDGTMLVSIGDGGNPPVRVGGMLSRDQAQRLQSHLGKVLRMRDDGSAPSDNPFVNTPDADPLVFTYGHRNIQGMALDGEGRIWASEHGAMGGDELNLLRPGSNYGWPKATYSREYSGPRISGDAALPGMVDPVVVWTPCIAPSGLALYTGDAFPAWKGSLFAGGLVLQQIRRLTLDGERVTGEETLQFEDRVRDVRQGPDGFLYVLTDEADGALLRIEPSR